MIPATAHPARGESQESSNSMTPPVVPVELPPGGSQRFPSQRPYTYGMVMLCMGALINWIGLTESYFQPVRYIGVACIITGAMLIIAAMCCWMNSHTPVPPSTNTYNNSNNVHVIDIPENPNTTVGNKPPDYESITAPPTYDVAIKLNPAHLIMKADDELKKDPVPLQQGPISTEIVPVHKY